jgi:hypothetical protein
MPKFPLILPQVALFFFGSSKIPETKNNPPERR